MRSKLRQQVAPVQGLKPQVITLSGGAQTTKGDAIAHVDDNGALGVTRTAVVVISTGFSGAADFTITPKIQESDDTTDGNFADVTLADSAALPTAVAKTGTVGFAYFFLDTTKLKKYFRVFLTSAGTTTDTATAQITVILGDGSIESLPRGTVPTVYRKA